MNAELWIGLVTLAALEIVLGVDNLIFQSIIASKLPTAELRDRARKLGLLSALGSRIVLISCIGFIVSLTQPVFTVGTFTATGRDLALCAGGLILLAKVIKELHGKVTGEEHLEQGSALHVAKATMGAVLIQIALVDVVFSLDSVLTAVGMVKSIPIMIAANVIAIGVMLFASKWIVHTMEKAPTLKVLALSFLIAVAVLILAEAFHQHVSKGILYFAMVFALAVELMNMRVRRKQLSAAGIDPDTLKPYGRSDEPVASA